MTVMYEPGIEPATSGLQANTLSIRLRLYEDVLLMLFENHMSRSNCEAGQRLCFRYMDSTILLLRISKVSSFWCSSVTAPAAQRLVFS